MNDPRTLTYAAADGVARITLNRPERGNGITPQLLGELEQAVEYADLDPAVKVILLAGNGKGFCGGYDLVETAEGMGGAAADGADRGSGAGAELGSGAGAELGSGAGAELGSGAGAERGSVARADQDAASGPPGAATSPAVIAANHDPSQPWDPTVDFAMMSRNVRAFMSLFHSTTPVVCKVHGFCVAGGTDLALCSDLLIAAADARIGYPPARVWGSPTTSMWAYRIGAQRAKRLLFTGDLLSGREAVEWGLAIEAPAPEQLEERTETLVRRIARMPLNQLRMMKLLVNQSLFSQGLHATQLIGTVFDGIARHTPEGYAFQERAAAAGFRHAVRERDEPFGDDRGAGSA